MVENNGSNLTTSYTYDANGAETGITNPNTTTVAKVYDDAGRLTSITNKNSSNTTLSSFSYGYDDDNRRTSCTEADSTSVSFGYDGAGRLTSESRSGTNSISISYVVDGVGNRTSQTVGSTTTNFTYSDDDELTATSGGFGNSYSYNDNGEQTGRTLGSTSYTLAWDYDGQLTSTTQGSTVVSFTYDGLGRRLTRAAGGTTTQFLSSGSQVYLEAVGSNITAYYAYGNALIRKDGEYPMFDGLGSERTVTNSSQTVTGTLNMDGFGNAVGSTGSSSNPYMYAATSGYRSDGDAGLMHVGARYYDAQVGRFTSRDTVLSEHPYAYCEHDPVNRVDPDGHKSELKWGIEIEWGIFRLQAEETIETGGPPADGELYRPGPPTGGGGYTSNPVNDFLSDLRELPGNFVGAVSDWWHDIGRPSPGRGDELLHYVGY